MRKQNLHCEKDLRLGEASRLLMPESRDHRQALQKERPDGGENEPGDQGCSDRRQHHQTPLSGACFLNCPRLITQNTKSSEHTNMYTLTNSRAAL